MTVTVRYWAAAQAAAGTESDEIAPGRVADVLRSATDRHPDLDRVLAVASVLVDGVPAQPTTQVADGGTVEILPPFAGG